MRETSARVLPRPDLTDVPLDTADIVMFVGGSCKKNPDGTNVSGYAEVTSNKVLKSSSLPSHFSAQVAELVEKTKISLCTQIVNMHSRHFTCLHNSGKIEVQ